MTLPTTPAVQNAAWDVTDAIREFARVVLDQHGDHLGNLAERSAMANLDQVVCWLTMVEEQGRLA